MVRTKTPGWCAHPKWSPRFGIAGPGTGFTNRTDCGYGVEIDGPIQIGVVSQIGAVTRGIRIEGALAAISFIDPLCHR